MSVPMVTVKKPLRYAGKRIEPGKGFTASRKDAKLLHALGKARPGVVQPPPPAPRPAAAPKASVAKTVKVSEVATQGTVAPPNAVGAVQRGPAPLVGDPVTGAIASSPGTYIRRDMTAEDPKK